MCQPMFEKLKILLLRINQKSPEARCLESRLPNSLSYYCISALQSQ